MKLPIGISDFKEIILNKYEFIDKTLFIKQIIDDAAQVVLVTRPRRFGKTINMSMLFYYLNNNDKAPDLDLFSNLAIDKESETRNNHYQQYPTIFITLKNIKSLTFYNALSAIKILISDVYDQYSAILLYSPKLTEQQKISIKSIINKTANEEEIKESLKKLIFYLYKIYDKKAVLLIDEYDAPIHSGYLNNYYSEIIDLMSGILGEALKDSTYLQKGVITGITRVAQASIFSGINNIEVYSVLRDDYSQYFGFSENEVSQLLNKYGLSSQLENIKLWYNGYIFGKQTIYNPWSILKCLKQNCELEPYWVNTSDNSLIKILLDQSPTDTKEIFENLIQGQEVTCVIDEHLVFPNLNNNANALWSLLLFTGYLTLRNKKIGSNGLPMGKILIPNKEITSLYIRIIEEWFVEGLTNSDYNNLLTAFNNYNVNLIELYLKKYISQSGSYFDFTKKAAEQLYHIFILGLVAGLSNKFLIKSNQEAGLGRVDVALIPYDKTKAGIIIEFKTAAHEKDLENAAKNELEQINNNKYIDILTDHKIKKALLIGLAFYGKKLQLEYLNQDIKPI